MAFDLDLIKSRLSITDVAERLNIVVPRRGDAECPRHGGKSLRIKEKEGFFFCHGGCAASGGTGDIFSLYQFVTGSDFRTAVTDLASWANVDEVITPEALRAISHRRSLEDVFAFAADFYRGLYPGSPAQEYARQQGIDLDAANLGYAPDSWNDLVSALSVAGIDMILAAEAGLVKLGPRGYYDFFRHRLIIPAFTRGRCTYLQARAIGEGETVKEKEATEIKYKNIAHGDIPLYSINGALSHSSIVLAESTSDTIRLTVAGLPAVGTYGAPKDYQVKQLQRFDTITFAAQNDAVGRKFADDLAPQLGEKLRIAPAPAGYKDWKEALNAGEVWQVDENLTWLRWKLAQLDPTLDPVPQKKALRPLLVYLAALDDPAMESVYLDEIAAHFKWKREVRQAYAKSIRTLRSAQTKKERHETADLAPEQDELGASIEPPVFLSPALAFHEGLVYLSAKMAFEHMVPQKNGPDIKETVWTPVILTSDRRRLIPQNPPKGSHPDAVTWLSQESNLALSGSFYSAPEKKWSYSSMMAFMHGSAPKVAIHEIYDELMTSLRKYVYHQHEDSYHLDVVWTIGTYFFKLWHAFPYLALSGEKGAGKTTLLTWLWAVAFNAEFVVNTSEAALYRSIQANSPTLLIDEQEGLNSSKAAKENKADLMGILKSGYKEDGRVARQRLDDPSRTEYFHVYSPKAIASIGEIENVLANRCIKTFMMKKPDGLTLDDDSGLAMYAQERFAPIRDQLYLLLMQEASNVAKMSRHVQLDAANRFRELFLPMFTIAGCVDFSRGDKSKPTVQMLTESARRTAEQNKDEESSTPEGMLRLALAQVCAQAGSGNDPLYATLEDDGSVTADAIQIKDAFETLFTTAKQSFFNDQWLGRNILKMRGISPASPRRRWRTVNEFSEVLRETVLTKKFTACYRIDPAYFRD